VCVRERRKSKGRKQHLTSILLVRSSWFWSVILDDGTIFKKGWWLSLKTYIINPTGNTAPPRSFTKPGLDSFRLVAPPETMDDSKFPKDNITPAANLREGGRESSMIYDYHHKRLFWAAVPTAFQKQDSYLSRCFWTAYSTIRCAVWWGFKVEGSESITSVEL